MRIEAAVAGTQARAVWTPTRSGAVSIRVGKQSRGSGRTPAGCPAPTGLSTPGQVQSALGIPAPETDPERRWDWSCCPGTTVWGKEGERWDYDQLALFWVEREGPQIAGPLPTCLKP